MHGVYIVSKLKKIASEELVIVSSHTHVRTSIYKYLISSPSIFVEIIFNIKKIKYT
jgi:isoprenylcysteine carboxyl methyltransferase (ICMT) family protein YpbQ